MLFLCVSTLNVIFYQPMAKKKNIKPQDVSAEDMEYINYKMNPDSAQYTSLIPTPYVNYDYTVKIKCKNQKQKEYLNLLKDDSKIIVSATGAPGSGKSYISLAYALQALKQQQFKRLICFIPTAPAGASAL